MALSFLKKIFSDRLSQDSKKNKFAFVSFDEDDIFFVKELSHYLETQELPRLDNRYGIGTSKIENVEQKIKESEVFLLIMSKNSRTSADVTKEFKMAIRESKLVIPISLENEIFIEFENVQSGDAAEIYSLLIELAERLREILTPFQIPSKHMQKKRIEYVLVLLFESLGISEQPILYDGKKLVVESDKILNEKIEGLDELDWLEVFLSVENIFISEKHCRANYNSEKFPTLNCLVDYLCNKLNWEEIKDIQLTGIRYHK